MAKKIVVLCDPCRPLGKNTPADYPGYTVTIGSGDPRTIDLCAAHWLSLARGLEHALELYARGAEETPKKGQRLGWKRRFGPVMCEAGCGSAPLKTAYTFEQHLRRVHDGMTLDEYTVEHGELVALTDEQMAGLVIETQCDECGQTYSTAWGNRYPQLAMVTHMRGAHLQTGWRPGDSGATSRVRVPPAG